MTEATLSTGNVIAIICSAASVMASFIYVRFQTTQNKCDIQDLKRRLELDEQRTAGLYEKIADKLSSRDERMFNELKSNTTMILSNIDLIKKEFRSVETCDSFRTECRNHQNKS